MTDAPHHQAAFINAIREEGTKSEACDWLQKTWNELCEARAALALRTPSGAGDLVARLLKQATYLEAAYGWTGDIEEAAAHLAVVTAANARLREALSKNVSIRTALDAEGNIIGKQAIILFPHGSEADIDLLWPILSQEAPK